MTQPDSTDGPEGPLTPPRPRRGRPPSTESRGSRARILVEARRLFARNGYEATSIKDIGDAAGLTAPTIYHHFGSKYGLFAAAYVDADRILFADFKSALVGVDGFKAKMTALIDASRQRHEIDPTVAGFLSAAQVDSRRTNDRKEALTDALATASGEIDALLLDLVVAAQADGEIAPAADPQAVVTVILATTLGIALVTTMIEPEMAADLFVEWKRLMTGDLIV